MVSNNLIKIETFAHSLNKKRYTQKSQNRETQQL